MLRFQKQLNNTHFNSNDKFKLSYSKCCELLKRPNLLFYIKDCECFCNLFAYFHQIHAYLSRESCT
ncbi:MAG: hypothetical protein LBQ68_06850 [Clostridiales bacterium]|nr:hypothetical protein [Clostridiales bacterium]